MKITSLSQLDNAIELKKKRLLSKGATFLKSRVKDNYYKASVEGMPAFAKHSRLTETIHGKHPLFNLTGKGIESVKIRNTSDPDAKQVFTKSRGLVIAEKGSTQVVTEGMSSWFKSKGATVPAGTVLTQPKRPVFEYTANSPFSKKDLIDHLN